MKRTLIEIAAVGGVLLLLSVLHTEIRSLQSEETTKQAELEELREIVQIDRGEVTAGLARTIDDHQGRLSGVQRRIMLMEAEIEVLQSQLATRTSQAERQATEAMKQSSRLSGTVEANESKMREREEQLRQLTQDLRKQVVQQEGLITSLRNEIVRDTKDMSVRMLSPTVQLAGDETVGSGTMIASRLNETKDGYDSYVLTAHHVVRNILADQPELERLGIQCTIYTSEGRIERRCDLVAKRVSCDLALLKLRGNERIRNVAKLVSQEGLSDVEIWTPVFAVGCPLGNDPIPTGGFVANLASEVNGASYWMINAPTYFGNSGGGIYNGDTRELIAVFSKIYTHGRIRPVVIPHMGLAVPMDQVFAWLKEEDYGFLVPGSSGTGTAKPQR